MQISSQTTRSWLNLDLTHNKDTRLAISLLDNCKLDVRHAPDGSYSLMMVIDGYTRYFHDVQSIDVRVAEANDGDAS